MAQVQTTTTRHEAAPTIVRQRARIAAFPLFVAVSFPIFVWAIANVLVTISQWLLRLTAAETMGVAAYILGFAFLESLIVWLVLLGLTRLLPARWVGPGVAPLVFLGVSLTLGLLIYLDMEQQGAMSRGSYGGALLALAVYAVALALLVFAVRRSPRLGRLMHAFLDRLAPLAVLYAIVGLAGLVLVIVRNLL